MNDEQVATQDALMERDITSDACILEREGFNIIDSILLSQDLSVCDSSIILSQIFRCEWAIFLAEYHGGVKDIAFMAA